MQGVILTLSAKNKGICLTVYYPPRNKIYRLVSDNNGKEMPITLKAKLELLDVIECTPLSPVPIGPQKENIVIDMNVGIKRIGHYLHDIAYIYEKLSKYQKNNNLVFGNNSNKLIYVDWFKHSIEIHKVTNLIIEKKEQKTRATFKIGDVEHDNYSVTDFNYFLKNSTQNKVEIGNAYIIVSIPFLPYCKNGMDLGYYKFIAAIYPIDNPDITTHQMTREHSKTSDGCRTSDVRK